MVDIFGSRIRDKLSNFKVSAWGMDPWIRGAYSAAQPGKTGMRAELARCIDDRLFFAGEATSPRRQALTGHDRYYVAAARAGHARRLASGIHAFA